jgi:hypothetical protein
LVRSQWDGRRGTQDDAGCPNPFILDVYADRRAGDWEVYAPALPKFQVG